MEPQTGPLYVWLLKSMPSLTVATNQGESIPPYKLCLIKLFYEAYNGQLKPFINNVAGTSKCYT